MRYKLSHDVRTSTIYDKYEEVNQNYTEKDIPYLNSLKSGIWNPTNIKDIEQTVLEIENLKPTLVICENSTEWNHMRRMISSMSYSKGRGRGIKFYMIDDVTKKILGLAEIASDFGSLKVRDQFIGWTKNQKFNEGKLKNTCIGATIVPVGVLGYNFYGGKLLSLLMTSGIVREAWETKYGDKLVGITTTGLFGHKESGSQYTGLRPVWKSLGHTEGNVIMNPNDNVYKRCTEWLKKYFLEEYNYTMSKSRPKQGILKLICSKLGIVSDSLVHKFERGVYFSEFYKDTKDFLRGEIDEVTVPRFDSSIESLVSRWKSKAIERYRKLAVQNKVKNKVLYYSNVIGKTWTWVLRRYMGIVISKKSPSYSFENFKLATITLTEWSNVCLKRLSQLSDIITWQYFKSFLRAN
jgi:hypothetical protein